MNYRTARSLFGQLPDGTDAEQLHVYTIGIGQETDSDVLDAIAQRTNGHYYSTSALPGTEASASAATSASSSAPQSTGVALAQAFAQIAAEF